MNHRFFVPDLTPNARRELQNLQPRFLFIAESPHLSEVEPDELLQRRPLCGMAGRQWWGALAEVLEKKPKLDSALVDVSLEKLIQNCLKYKICILNSVQFPLDPKITKKFPKADPLLNVGFYKGPGEKTYKKQKNSIEMKKALASLRDRLQSPKIAQVPIYCLGNDAEWFLNLALEKNEIEQRYLGRIPHPSAWWRRGGYFGKVAKEKLTEIFSQKK